MRLTTNMRLYQFHNFYNNNLKQKEFAEFLLKIGNGKYPVHSATENMIFLPTDIIILNIKGNLANE